MKLTFRDIELVIQRELGWCELNPLPEIDKKYREGFIAGLKQAYRIIKSLSEMKD